ncbi:MAG TPA: tetratricopeptide repeat protein [candidate division WOR-3 bacterium]|uniref:Tetratricopeptide repeat protein n=1 Tax=candidate division WOR-3 bacterium TaxID=2052148 RepID=A0A9C9EN26_UNCW3|nr:tetratricopeptide repeat protein [candidate division WOR-3 bacterium]
MKCPGCGADNPPKNKFCGECGARLRKSSETERIDLVRKDIPESLVKKIILTKDTIEKERKDVTVVFADISGFTSMSEKLDPEELTLLMNECFRKLGAMVYRYEGIIDKFIGDCIMAIFGAPITHEDDPERAILACLDMQSALDEINKNLDPSLKKLTIHSGINTGEVIAGKIGSDLQMEYTVMGDTVNVAQRLKDIAPSGSILTGPETYNRSRHAFDFMAMEPVQLKGKADKVQPYEVIGRKWGSEYGHGAIHSDLIGRDKELEALKKGYADLLKGKSSIYVIKGEIGVGKSRLLYEFKKFLTITAPDIALLDSRGVSYESSIPLKSFADSLVHYLNSQETSPIQITEASIKKQLSDLLKDEASETLPYLYKMMNIPLNEQEKEKILYLDSHSLQLQIFLAMTTVLEKISEEKPVVFIIDDIQWLDSISVELINFLLPMVKSKKVSFFLSYRVGPISVIEKLLQTIKDEYCDYVVDVELSNLSPDDSSRLIDNLIGGEISDALRKYVIVKSGGNPFFIEEIVRRIIESKILTKGEKFSEQMLQIPGSIDAAVTSRIDSLNKEAKYLLRIAAIIGRSFPRDLLEEVVKDKEIYQHIDELEKAEFLIKINKEQKTFYTFRHALFQEVAYNSLLKSERTIYHKVIAETIEEKFKDKIEGYASSLAHHYYNCKNTEKALYYSIKAGDEAAELYANEEALDYYNKALSITEETAQKITLLEKISEIEILIGRLKQAHEHLLAAQESATDKLVKARITEKISRVLEQIGKIDESIELRRAAIQEISDQDSPVLIQLHYDLSNVLLESKGEMDEAMCLVDNGLTIARRIKDRKLEAEGLRAKGHILWRLGKNEEALSLLKTARSIYEEYNEIKILPYLFLLTAAGYRALGNIDTAIEFVKKSIEIAERIGNRRVLAMCYNNLGAYYAYRGNFKASIEITEKNVEIRQQLGDKKGEGIGLMNIGLTHKYLGQFDRVMEYYERAEKLFEAINDLRCKVTVYHHKAGLLSVLGKNKEAYAYYKKAIELAETTQDKALLGDSQYRLADHYMDINDLDRAEELLKEAEVTIEQAGEKNLQAEIFLSLSSLYIKKKDKKALDYAQKGFKYAAETKLINTEIRGLREYGRALALIGNEMTEGIKHIKRAIAIAKETNSKEQIAHSMFALGEVLIADEKPTQAREYLKKAKEIYRELNTPVWLKETEELLKKTT